MSQLKKQDPEVYELIKKEQKRQQDKLSMIPSENFFSKAVREAIGSVFMHKYAEGNIGKRYYEGNKYVDKLERLTHERVRKLFKLPNDWDSNVQALSGSTANLAVYLALLNIGDTIMGMYLPDGGHLSHGWSYDSENKQKKHTTYAYLGGNRKVHITSKIFNTIQYKTDPNTQRFDWDKIEELAIKYKPKLIITGGTAYPRDFDYKRVKKIAVKVNAYYMADIAHEAGLVATEVLNSPIGIADVVTMTTHKTLRAGRGAIILASKENIKKINKAVLPGLLGGPFNNNIAGICVGLKEAMTKEFKDYAKQIVKNSKYLAQKLKEYNFNLVTGGTDKHLILINLKNKGIYGKKVAKALDIAGIVANMNTIPGETRPPSDPSGLRLGTPWITTRGMKESEMGKIAKWINDVVNEAKNYADLELEDFLDKMKNNKKIISIRKEIKNLCQKFPLDI